MFLPEIKNKWGNYSIQKVVRNERMLYECIENMYSDISIKRTVRLTFQSKIILKVRYD